MMETNKLLLRRTKREELPRLMEIEQHLENRPELFVSTLEEHEYHRTSDDYLLFSILEKEKEEMVGYAMIQLDHHSKTFLLRRIALTKKNRGYGRSSLAALLKYCFEKTPSNRFYLDVYPHNERAIYLYEELGLVWEGTMRENYFYEGKFLDQRLYSLLRKEYERMDLKERPFGDL